MNKLAWLDAVARQFFHLINIAVVIDLINPYHFLSNETKLKLGFAYFKYVWDMLPERECLCRVLLSLFIESFLCLIPFNQNPFYHFLLHEAPI